MNRKWILLGLAGLLTVGILDQIRDTSENVPDERIKSCDRGGRKKDV